MALDSSNQMFTQPKFPSKPMFPANVSMSPSAAKPAAPVNLSKPVDSKMQLAGIGMMVVGIILLAIGIMTWK